MDDSKILRSAMPSPAAAGIGGGTTSAAPAHPGVEKLTPTQAATVSKHVGKGLQEAPEEEERLELADPFWLRRTVRRSSSLLISALLHMLGLIILGLFTVPQKVVDEVREVVADIMEP